VKADRFLGEGGTAGSSQYAPEEYTVRGEENRRSAAGRCGGADTAKKEGVRAGSHGDLLSVGG
jgi:hypothetical protein